jgi:hypothetical protein
MHEGELALRGEAGRDERKVLEFAFDQTVDHPKPVRTLGMTLAGVVFQVTVVFDDRKG